MVESVMEVRTLLSSRNMDSHRKTKSIGAATGSEILRSSLTFRSKENMNSVRGESGGLITSQKGGDISRNINQRAVVTTIN